MLREPKGFTLDHLMRGWAGTRNECALLKLAFFPVPHIDKSQTTVESHLRVWLWPLMYQLSVWWFKCHLASAQTFMKPSDPVPSLRVHCGNLGMNLRANIAVFQNSRHWHPLVCILFRESNCSEVKTEHLSHRFLPAFFYSTSSG